MYWEESIEFIKNHQSEPGDVYEYEGGTVKTSYIKLEEFSEKFKNTFKKYLKYGLEDIQIFCSLGASQGIGLHNDETNVLIICLEGEMSYVIEDSKPVVLKTGDTIFIKHDLLHKGISSNVPRICLSCGVEDYIPSNEVTYFFG